MSASRDRIRRANAALTDVIGFLEPRGEPEELTRDLLKRFGSPGAAVEAGKHQLASAGLSEQNAMILGMIPDLIRHMERQKFGAHPSVGTLVEAEAYMAMRYIGQNIERFYMLALDSSGRLIECVHIQSGSEESAPFYLSEDVAVPIARIPDLIAALAALGRRHNLSLYAFGHGLSYTTFEYSDLRVARAAEGALTVTVEVANTGARDGDDVVQLYATPPAASQPQEIRALCGFTRVSLKAGEKRTLTITVPAIALRRWSVAKKDYEIPAGEWTLAAGASSADLRQTAKIKL